MPELKVKCYYISGFTGSDNDVLSENLITCMRKKNYLFFFKIYISAYMDCIAIYSIL